MARKTKKPQPKPTKPDGETTVQRLRRLLHAEEGRLAMETEPGKRQTAARTVLMFFSELRKAEHAALKHIEKVTRQVVIAWARTLDPEERRSVAREIVAMDAEGSILA